MTDPEAPAPTETEWMVAAETTDEPVYKVVGGGGGG